MSAYIHSEKENIPAWLNISLLEEYAYKKEQEGQDGIIWKEDWEMVEAAEWLWNLGPVIIADASSCKDWKSWEIEYIKRNYKFNAQNNLTIMAKDLCRSRMSVNGMVNKLRKKGEL